MKTPDASEDTPPEHPPLAHDADGNALPVPDGTAAFLIARATKGAPRVVRGLDKRPTRFPTSITPEELLDVCGPDVYRVTAVDDKGEKIDYVTTVVLGRDLRNAAPVPTPIGAAHVLGPGSELRFALDTVAQLARTNGEALRALSESQADWIKAIAAAKGLPRNVAMTALPPPYRREDDDDEEDEDDDDDRDDQEDEDDQSAKPSPSPMETFITMANQFVPVLMAEWMGKKNGSAATSDAPATPANDDPGAGLRLLACIHTQLTQAERRWLDRRLANATDGPRLASDLAQCTVEQVVGMVREAVAKHAEGVASQPRPQSPSVTSQPEAVLAARAKQILGILDPTVRARAITLCTRVMQHKDTPEAQQILQALLPLSDEHAAEWLTANLSELELRFAW